jgi:Transcription factor WhiB
VLRRNRITVLQDEGIAMHKANRHLMPGDEATAHTPCAVDPERWFPVDQKPDPEAVAACWSCYFQRRCARRALAQPLPDHGIWGGYRLAPGRGLKRSRHQLAIIAGEAMGPPVSPGAEVLRAIEHDAPAAGDDACGLIDLADRMMVRDSRSARLHYQPARGPYFAQCSTTRESAC